MTGFPPPAVAGRRVVLRLDLNVPLAGGAVADASRVEAVAPTLQALAGAGCPMVVLSHLGRPQGRDPAYGLEPVGERLAAAAGLPVLAASGAEGLPAAAAATPPGEVLLAPNTRFEDGEAGDEDALAASWAALGEVFVNDAFSVCHRAHASVVGVARHLPAFPGPLLAAEVAALRPLREGPPRPFAAFLGGAKLATKLPLVESLLRRVDILALGGGLANTFLAAKGYEVGRSLHEPALEAQAKSLMARHATRISLPASVVVRRGEGELREVAANSVTPEDSILDLSVAEVGRMVDEAATAATVFWNGAVGAFEIAGADRGTFALARLLADHSGQVVVGGGETLAATALAGVAGGYAHSSLGGGATLAYLAGEALPGLEVVGL